MGNVLKISEAASIALHAMFVMSQIKDELISVKEIAEILDISANHLSKVLQRLVKAELVVSVKGFNGGFKLAKNPENITFLDIYEAIDGRFHPSSCLLNKLECQHICIMGGFLKSLNSQVEEFFSKTKLSEFSTKKE
ncbi:MAG TPA: Rrf2 family transcriptional regulator [Candidatus Gastranaerophilales bacterium]|nr:Rrf2 family transcriptional regulator [Candidatus Gastranaerophilales bacterium]